MQLFLLSLKEKRWHWFWLGLFVLAMLVPIWNMASYLASLNGQQFLILSGLFRHLPWLYGPLVWIHITLTGDSRADWRRRSLHFLPFILQCLLSFLPVPQLQFLTSGTSHFAILVGHITSYIVLSCLYLLSRRRLFFTHQAKPLPAAYVGYTTLIVGLLIIMLWDFWVSGRSLFWGIETLELWNLLFLVEGGYVTLLALLAPTLRWQLDLPTLKKRTSRLTETAAASLADLIQQHMETERLYVDPDISLVTLAEKIGISTHDLSEVLNVQLKQSFYEFINYYRVRMACLKLNDDSNVSATDIGFACGFNSKSAFYNAFKKQLDTTPAKYRAMQRSE